MDKFISGAGDILLQMGFPGIVIVGLSYVCYRLAKLYVEAQEKRIVETQATTSALTANSTVLNRVADILQRQKSN